MRRAPTTPSATGTGTSPPGMSMSTPDSARTRVRFWDGEMFDEDNYGVSGSIMLRGAYRVGATVNAGHRTDLRASRVGDYMAVDLNGALDIGRGIELVPVFSWSRLQRDGG